MQPYFVNERLQQAQQFDQTCVTLVTNILFAWFLFAFSGLPDFFLVTDCFWRRFPFSHFFVFVFLPNQVKIKKSETWWSISCLNLHVVSSCVCSFPSFMRFSCLLCELKPPSVFTRSLCFLSFITPDWVFFPVHSSLSSDTGFFTGHCSWTVFHFWPSLPVNLCV